MVGAYHKCRVVGPLPTNQVGAIEDPNTTIPVVAAAGVIWPVWPWGGICPTRSLAVSGGDP